MSTKTSNKVLAEMRNGGTIAITDAHKWRYTICDRVFGMVDGVTSHNAEINQAIKYLKDNDVLIEKLLDMDSTQEAMCILREDRNLAEILLRDMNFCHVANSLPIPSLDACLQLKDELGITDRGWNRVAETFKLPKDRRLYQLISYRRKFPSPHRTESGRGYTYEIRDMIQHAIRTESIPPSSDIQVKLSLDAGAAHKGAKVQAELFQMDVISWTNVNNSTSNIKSTSELKSNHNSYLISIFLPEDGGRDPETNSHMKIELADAIKFINSMIEQPKLEFEDKTYSNIQFLLCTDMKCLCEVLGKQGLVRDDLQRTNRHPGLIAVYHSKATFGCCWCEIKRVDMGRFDFESWPFRDIHVMKERWLSIKDTSLSTRKRTAKERDGLYAEPLFALPLTQIIPCNLHLTMSIVKMLRKHLVMNIRGFPAAAEELEKALKEIGIKVYKPKDSQKMSLEERLKKTRFSRPNSLNLLKNCEIVLRCLDRLPPSYAAFGKNTKIMWEQALVLLAWASDPEAEIDEQTWMYCAKQFASWFVDMTHKKKVTSYLHCFVYHYGYFLEQYGRIEGLANYSIESNMKWMKERIQRSTNHAGGRKGDMDCWRQLLQLHFRSQDTMKAKLPQGNRKTWTSSLESSQKSISDIFDLPGSTSTGEEGEE